MAWEYKVVPAPVKGVKEKGVKTPEARFALCIEHLLNEMAADDWQFHRAETLPSEERAGLTSTQTVWRHVMIFRRALDVAGDETAAEAAPAVLTASPPPLALENVADLDTHDDADPVSADLGDTLRATRETDMPAARRLGPATADD